MFIKLYYNHTNHPDFGGLKINYRRKICQKSVNNSKSKSNAKFEVELVQNQKK